MAPYLRQQGTARQLIVNDQPLILLSGELHNSSASSLAYMEPIWPRLAELGLNTVIAPLYWELIEPEEGCFDFTLLDGLVEGARAHGLHLVFLWFGTWKNTISCYVPEWVKTDLARFPRLQHKPGANSSILSPFCRETQACDARAFAAVMRRIREIDEDRQTVVMMQAENEVGVLNSARDWSAAAQQAFDARVPPELLQALAARGEALQPEVCAAWARNGRRLEGSWTEVFGVDAAEFFMAWHFARYIDAVAEAGRREYDLPVYVNAWLRQRGMEKPGGYPSGGPVARVMEIWRAAAPHLDFYAPDIYVPVFKDTCADYARDGNPLFIPEAWNDERAASAVLYAIGRHDAIGFAPFAIDDVPPDNPLAETYHTLAGMMPLLTACQGQGRMAGFYQETDTDTDTVLLGGYQVRLGTMKALQPGTPPAGGLVIALDEPDEFIILGRNLSVEFMTPGAEIADTELLWMDQGRYIDGQWQPERRLNGDESAHNFSASIGDRLTTLRVKVNRQAMPLLHQGNYL